MHLVLKPLTLALAIWLGILVFLAPPILVDLSSGSLMAAMADDDDNDDDDDDRADTSTSASSGGGTESRARLRRGADRVIQRQRAAAPPPPPAFAPEIVVSDLAPSDLAVLVEEGFTLIERRTITTLGVTLDRLGAPPAWRWRPRVTASACSPAAQTLT